MAEEVYKYKLELDTSRFQNQIGEINTAVAASMANMGQAAMAAVSSSANITENFGVAATSAAGFTPQYNLMSGGSIYRQLMMMANIIPTPRNISSSAASAYTTENLGLLGAGSAAQFASKAIPFAASAAGWMLGSAALGVGGFAAAPLAAFAESRFQLYAGRKMSATLGGRSIYGPEYMNGNPAQGILEKSAYQAQMKYWQYSPSELSSMMASAATSGALQGMSPSQMAGFQSQQIGFRASAQAMLNMGVGQSNEYMRSLTRGGITAARTSDFIYGQAEFAQRGLFSAGQVVQMNSAMGSVSLAGGNLPAVGMRVLNSIGGEISRGYAGGAIDPVLIRMNGGLANTITKASVNMSSSLNDIVSLASAMKGGSLASGNVPSSIQAQMTIGMRNLMNNNGLNPNIIDDLSRQKMLMNAEDLTGISQAMNMPAYNLMKGYMSSLLDNPTRGQLSRITLRRMGMPPSLWRRFEYSPEENSMSDDYYRNRQGNIYDITERNRSNTFWGITSSNIRRLPQYLSSEFPSFVSSAISGAFNLAGRGVKKIWENTIYHRLWSGVPKQEVYDEHLLYSPNVQDYRGLGKNLSGLTVSRLSKSKTEEYLQYSLGAFGKMDEPGKTYLASAYVQTLTNRMGNYEAKYSISKGGPRVDPAIFKEGLKLKQTMALMSIIGSTPLNDRYNANEVKRLTAGFKIFTSNKDKTKEEVLSMMMKEEGFSKETAELVYNKTKGALNHTAQELVNLKGYKNEVGRSEIFSNPPLSETSGKFDKSVSEAAQTASESLANLVDSINNSSHKNKGP